MSKKEPTPFVASEYIESEEDIILYLEEAMATEDRPTIMRALDVISEARARLRDQSRPAV